MQNLQIRWTTNEETETDDLHWNKMCRCLKSALTHKTVDKSDESVKLSCTYNYYYIQYIKLAELLLILSEKWTLLRYLNIDICSMKWGRDYVTLFSDGHIPKIVIRLLIKMRSRKMAIWQASNYKICSIQVLFTLCNI